MRFARYIAIEALADAMPENEARLRQAVGLMQQTIDGMPSFLHNAADRCRALLH